MGGDPEFFFKKDEKIIGSDKVIPITGIAISESNIIRDGVQAELNYKESSCRALSGNSIREALLTLERHLLHKEIEADFSQTIKIEQEELDSLSAAARVFGCMPSYNAYENPKEAKGVPIDASTYLYRSAGGHLHYNISDSLKPRIVDVVKLLDIFLGNTCVLLDRDEGNKERRKMYGKAGEFRLPWYGLEYRTLSNFWMRDYILFSMVTGISKYVISLAPILIKNNDLYQEVFNLVDEKDIRKAINENDFELAMRNFLKIRKFWEDSTNDYTDGLNCHNMEAFLFFVSKGVDYWFSKNVIENWRNMEEGHKMGWEKFMLTVVFPKVEKIKKEKEEAIFEKNSLNHSITIKFIIKKSE